MKRKIKRKLRALLYESAGKYALKRGLSKRFMNLGYKGVPLDLKPGDMSEQLNFQLYNVISSGIDLKEKSILEIGCGRGGGCYFFKEYKNAGNVVGIDLSESNIKLARKLTVAEKNTFYCQSAEKINLPQQSFDGVVNLESSHCYTDKKVFFENVYALLKPGGTFIYADIFLSVNIPKIKSYLIKLGFILEREQDITQGVIDSLNERPPKNVPFHKKYIVPLFLGSFYGYKQSNKPRLCIRKVK